MIHDGFCFSRTKPLPEKASWTFRVVKKLGFKVVEKKDPEDEYCGAVLAL